MYNIAERHKVFFFWLKSAYFMVMFAYIFEEREKDADVVFVK